MKGKGSKGKGEGQVRYAHPCRPASDTRTQSATLSSSSQRMLGCCSEPWSGLTRSARQLQPRPLSLPLPPLQHRTHTHCFLQSLLAERGENEQPGGCPSSQKSQAQTLQKRVTVQKGVTVHSNLRGRMFSTTPIFLSRGLNLQWDKMGIWGSRNGRLGYVKKLRPGSRKSQLGKGRPPRPPCRQLSGALSPAPLNFGRRMHETLLVKKEPTPPI